MGGVALAFIAGLVGTLSPCVLPLIPILVGSSLNESRYGPFYLAAGLALSFTLFGFLIATVGFSIGLTTGVLQSAASIIMIAFGVVMIIPALYSKFSAASSLLSSGLNAKVGEHDSSGLWGQFSLGVLLGAVWTPCVGPTLGAAMTLAAQGEQLPYAAVVMFSYAVGTCVPVLILAFSSRSAATANKERLKTISKWLRPSMGLIFVAFGVLVLTGGLTVLEATVLELLPEKLVAFIYSF